MTSPAGLPPRTAAPSAMRHLNTLASTTRRQTVAKPEGSWDLLAVLREDSAKAGAVPRTLLKRSYRQKGDDHLALAVHAWIENLRSIGQAAHIIPFCERLSCLKGNHRIVSFFHSQNKAADPAWTLWLSSGLADACKSNDEQPPLSKAAAKPLRPLWVFSHWTDQPGQ
ncbi:hypothetical protein D9M70_423440 [compost metagenome]